MTLIATPSSPFSSFKEYEEVNLTVEFTIEATVTDGDSGGSTSTESGGTSGGSAPSIPGPSIVSATVEDSGIIVTLAQNTFTLTGSFQDVFISSLEYLNTSKKLEEVPSFSDIPAIFDALITFKPPVVRSIDVPVTVTFIGNSTFTYFVTVVRDFEAAARKLVNKVKEGIY